MVDQCNIPALSRRNKRQRENFGVAVPKDPIPASAGVGLPVEGSSAPSAGGLAWPLTEISRVTETVRIYDPSDVTVWVDVERVIELTVIDDDGTEGKIILTPTP